MRGRCEVVQAAETNAPVAVRGQRAGLRVVRRVYSISGVWLSVVLERPSAAGGDAASCACI
jgi:hypothetical protein